MFQRAATPLSMRSSVQHHARPFAAQCNNKRHQRAPASISMTRRRHHVVSASFSVSDITGPVNDTVNDLKSTEVRNFPQLLYSSSSLGERITIRFRLFAFFDDRSRETRGRPPSSSILPKDHPPPTRARFRAKEKKGGEEEEEENNGLEDGIRFEFFFISTTVVDVSLPIEFVSFFPLKMPRQHFFSFLSRRGGEVDFYFYFFLGLAFKKER